MPVWPRCSAISHLQQCIGPHLDVLARCRAALVDELLQVAPLLLQLCLLLVRVFELLLRPLAILLRPLARLVELSQALIDLPQASLIVFQEQDRERAER